MGEPSMQKRETEMAIEKKQSASPHFEALRDDLFREAAAIISEDPSAKIAIIVTAPAGSESDVSMYSFGHPSAESVFKTFLEDKDKGKAPMEDEDDEEEKDMSSRSGWWNDDKKFESMSPEELKAAFDQLVRLRNRLSLERKARLTTRGSSGNPEDLQNDEAERKP